MTIDAATSARSARQPLAGDVVIRPATLVTATPSGVPSTPSSSRAIGTRSPQTRRGTWRSTTFRRRRRVIRRRGKRRRGRDVQLNPQRPRPWRACRQRVVHGGSGIQGPRRRTGARPPLPRRGVGTWLPVDAVQLRRQHEHARGEAVGTARTLGGRPIPARISHRDLGDVDALVMYRSLDDPSVDDTTGIRGSASRWPASRTRSASRIRRRLEQRERLLWFGRRRVSSSRAAVSRGVNPRRLLPDEKLAKNARLTSTLTGRSDARPTSLAEEHRPASRSAVCSSAEPSANREAPRPSTTCCGSLRATPSSRSPARRIDGPCGGGVQQGT